MQGASEAGMPTAWRFGRYELWPTQRRLLLDGQPVSVEERAFDLLVLLARHHDRALDRREVTQALWGIRPVSDNTLRQVMYRARQAVDDDGKRQHVIRTLHGRSVQWVAPLQVVPDDAAGIAPNAVVMSPVAPLPELVAAPAARRSPSWLRWGGGVLVALLVVAGGSLLAVRNASAPPGARPLRVAIEPMANHTGDSALDWTRDGLPGLFAGLLGQAGGVDVVDPVRAARVWAYPPQQGRNRDAQFRFVTGADVLISGQLERLTEHLLQLDVTVSPSDAAPTQFKVTGPQAGVLVVDAVARVRHALALDPPAEPGSLPKDAFLAEAFARGMDLAAHGDWKNALAHFQVTVDGAPGLLGAQLNLGIAQTFTGAAAEGRRTFAALADTAAKQHDDRARMLALLWLARIERDAGHSAQAITGMREVAKLAAAQSDPEVGIEAHAILADTLYKTQGRAAAEPDLDAAAQLAAKHPELHSALAVLYDAQSEIANGEGDFATALDVAQKVLALDESIGDRQGVIVGKFYVAQALRSLGRPLDALTISAGAWKDAGAAENLDLQYDHGAMVVALMTDVGLCHVAQPAATTLDSMAQRLASSSDRFTALQLRAVAAMQCGDFHAALASLQQADKLVDPRQLERGDWLNQVLYEALACTMVAPGDLPAQLAAFEARAGEFGNDHVYARRRMQLRALVAAAAHQPDAALADLRAAANLPSAPEDRDFETRMPPLVIALATHQAPAAVQALAGYDAAATVDAGILPLVVTWLQKDGDTAAAGRAESHLASLRKAGRAALTAAGLNAGAPFVAVADAANHAATLAHSSAK